MIDCTFFLEINATFINQQRFDSYKWLKRRRSFLLLADNEYYIQQQLS